MSVREDEIELTNGASGIFSIVEKPDSAVIVPYDAGFVWLVEQFRYPVGERFWEFPQGGLEKGASPLSTARKELQEETGLIAGHLEPLGTLYAAYGFAGHKMHIFLGTDLTDTGVQRLDPEEGDLIYKRFALAEFEEMVREGVIQDAASVSAWSLWRMSPTYPTS